MAKLTLDKFVTKNKPQLEAEIRSICSNINELTHKDIEMWVLSDENLYLWARREGVKI